MSWWFDWSEFGYNAHIPLTDESCWTWFISNDRQMLTECNSPILGRLLQELSKYVFSILLLPSSYWGGRGVQISERLGDPSGVQKGRAPVPPEAKFKLYFMKCIERLFFSASRFVYDFWCCIIWLIDWLIVNYFNCWSPRSSDLRKKNSVR